MAGIDGKIASDLQPRRGILIMLADGQKQHMRILHFAQISGELWRNLPEIQKTALCAPPPGAQMQLINGNRQRLPSFFAAFLKKKLIAPSKGLFIANDTSCAWPHLGHSSKRIAAPDPAAIRHSDAV